MANQTITALPYEVTVGDLLDNTLTINVGRDVTGIVDNAVAHIEVTAGTVNFNAHGNAADGAAVGVGTKFSVTLKDYKINFKGAATTDKFLISI